MKTPPRSMAIAYVLGLLWTPTPSHAQAGGGSPTVQPTRAEVSDPEGPSTREVLGWSAVAAGGAFIVLSGYAMFRVHEIDSSQRVEGYRRGTPAGADMCDSAAAGYVSEAPRAGSPEQIRDDCATALKWQALGNYVFLPVGALSLGTGIYLLVSEPERDAVRVETALSAEGARVSVTLPF